MITLFRVVLLCGLFGMIVATFNIHKDNITHSCVLGVRNDSLSLILFTREIPHGQKINQTNQISCNKSFDLSKRIIFLVHGFLGNPYGTNITDLIVVLIQKGYIVFALDWSDAACTNDPIKSPVDLLEYPFASKNIHKVSNYLASFVISVASLECVSLENIVLMGHSLGAHICGLAAKKFYFFKINSGDKISQNISLLIGIDPAGLQYDYVNCDKRFCKEYVKRAVCLHTSCLGMRKSVAHLDLWFNDGDCQPKCDKISPNCCMCSHQIALIYMATLVDNFSYKGVHKSKEGKLSWLPQFHKSVSRYPSDKTNCTSINNRIMDSNDTLMGEYCVFVSKEYPYTGDNFSCTEVAANSKH